MLTPEQKKARETGIGASECAAVLGLSPYCTPYELWLIKTKRMEKEAILTESRLRLRNAHEQTIADEYEQRTGLKLKTVPETIYHKKYPFMLCHLDRVVESTNKIVECKTSSSFMKSCWGEDGSDQVPVEYVAQVQHQFACTGITEGDIAVLIDVDDYRIYPIERNENIIKTIEERIEHFWRFHVLEDNAPEPTTRSDIKSLYPKNNGNYLIINNDIKHLINEINNRKLIINNSEKAKDEFEIQLLKYIGEADGIKEGDDILATYLADKNGKRTLRLKKRA